MKAIEIFDDNSSTSNMESETNGCLFMMIIDDIIKTIYIANLYIAYDDDLAG